QFFACGEKQPNAPVWETGVHTHADGIIHIHPFRTYEEGSGARLVKWFEYGRGKLTNSSVNIPGSSKTYTNGDTCPDGKPGELQVYVTRAGATAEERLQGRALTRFIPHDGDRIRIVFGPPEEIIQTKDRTVIPEEQATRTIDVTVTDDGSEAGTRFEPSSLEVAQGEVVKLQVTNTGSISHEFRVAGADGTYENTDDFLVTPEGEDPESTGGILQPGARGSVILRLDVTGDVEFRDSTAATGTIVVRESESTPTPTPAPTGGAADVDVEFDLAMTDNAFSQTEFTVKSGEKFRFKLTNGGSFAHSLRIAGPDGEFDTDDDLVSDPHSILAGTAGELVGQIDKAGTYAFRCDFHQAEMTGTLTVE
ncbi:MAG TPA: cupredoxin domain-containing protein, partial [Dehalococcoidia bacterium]|nr:cupredoxin domain-containing protein [Dehalococcoidia bacterium]